MIKPESIEVSKLNKDFTYSDEIENVLLNFIKPVLGIKDFNTTTGYFPDYDATLIRFDDTTTTIEIKITSKTFALLEYARYDDSFSGLMTSRAEYTLIIAPISETESKTLGKIRLYKTSDLTKWICDNWHDNNIVKNYTPNKLNKYGSKNLMFDHRLHEDVVPHKWLGNIYGFNDGNGIKYQLNWQASKTIII